MSNESLPKTRYPGGAPPGCRDGTRRLLAVLRLLVVQACPTVLSWQAKRGGTPALSWTITAIEPGPGPALPALPVVHVYYTTFSRPVDNRTSSTGTDCPLDVRITTCEVEFVIAVEPAWTPSPMICLDIAASQVMS